MRRRRRSLTRVHQAGRLGRASGFGCWHHLGRVTVPRGAGPLLRPTPSFAFRGDPGSDRDAVLLEGLAWTHGPRCQGSRCCASHYTFGAGSFGRRPPGGGHSIAAARRGLSGGFDGRRSNISSCLGSSLGCLLRQQGGLDGSFWLWRGFSSSLELHSGCSPSGCEGYAPHRRCQRGGRLHPENGVRRPTAALGTAQLQLRLRLRDQARRTRWFRREQPRC
mmetsp:Transcript_36631/g.118329  ORF Transcript_36631/g.118329 Transcript_36631/m.118329 type:complete len:220 (+) Transcript_36631:428-1087(+)